MRPPTRCVFSACFEHLRHPVERRTTVRDSLAAAGVSRHVRYVGRSADVPKPGPTADRFFLGGFGWLVQSTTRLPYVAWQGPHGSVRDTGWDWEGRVSRFFGLGDGLAHVAFDVQMGFTQSVALGPSTAFKSDRPPSYHHIGPTGPTSNAPSSEL
jgi:hypothetical protein